MNDVTRLERQHDDTAERNVELVRRRHLVGPRGLLVADFPPPLVADETHAQRVGARRAGACYLDAMASPIIHESEREQQQCAEDQRGPHRSELPAANPGVGSSERWEPR